MDKNNKRYANRNLGFSLVELIIVIAIMAILAATISLAVVRYIERSRESDCINTRKTMEKEYFVEKVEEEDKQYARGNDDYVYTIDEYLLKHAGEYRCKSRGDYKPEGPDGQEADEDVPDERREHIYCTKHGSLYVPELPK
ncbi:MAG: prepilin-type N-terminal cleavage/methylation domain-containing protein [Eubacteriales bacterium]|nr:prepilin-type N-terminal cleavage/methylation domain-containing protein [Eubacteriales bacterium]